MVGHICLPINLDAFVLNGKVCDGAKTRIAPITQPDYVSLRLEDSVVPQDVLPQIDLHLSNSAVENPRISTAYSAPLEHLRLDNPKPIVEETVKLQESRLGVYLHWSLPRGYRSGGSAASPSSQATSNKASGTSPSSATSSNNTTQPKFRLVPNRWLVVRVLQKHLPPEANLPDVDAWVIESDRLRTMDEFSGDVDLETDVSPYVVYDPNAAEDNLLYSQAEKYIGYKSSLKNWSETNPAHVPLTSFDSSNPVFADYTIHNPNVFSIKDNFEYAPNQYLTYALCDYIAVGWHSSTTDDPFGPSGLKGDLASRLNAFLCQLNKDTLSLDPTVLKAIQNDTGGTSLLCHGAIYGVTYSRTEKPATIKGDVIFDNFQPDSAIEPVVVGTTPLDSILTFLQAHKDDTDAEIKMFGEGSDKTAASLLNMSELLYATEDNFDSRVKAADLLFYQNFKGSIGGFSWKYDKKKDPQEPDSPGIPSPTEATYLIRLNELQESLDIVERMLTLSRWQLFAEFFKFCSDSKGSDNKGQYKNSVEALYEFDPQNEENAPTGTMATLLTTKKTLEDGIAAIITPPKAAPSLVPAKKTAKDPFFLRADPTLMIAGMDSGWPEEYRDKVPIRFASDLKPPSNEKISSLLNKFTLPASSGDLTPTITLLLNEAIAGQSTSQIGFKNWDGQPFCPIFIEWEAMFYNVEFGKWDVELLTSSIDPTKNHPHVRYGNPTPLYDGNPKDIISDSQAISGRILILPQPSFSLAAIVKQVFSTASDKLPDSLTDQTKQAEFVNNLKQLSFVSGELMGFTDSLLTLGTGAHVKPNLRVQGDETVKPLAEAVTQGAHIGLLPKHFELMGAETAKTPFGTAYDFSGMSQPFKPVQHGQLGK